MSWFCIHEWEKVSEVTLPSAFEQMAAHTRVDNIEASVSYFKKKHILVVTCKQCGALRRFEADNP